jgi:tetratricopeptide (TPR) repeat protein
VLWLLAAAASAQPSSAARPDWLVVPFEVVSPSARTYWLGEGLAVLVSEELERLGTGVIPRDVRVGALDELRLPTSTVLSRATSIRIAELLGAAVIVFGRVQTDEATLTIAIRRLEVESGQLGSELVAQGSLHDLFPLARGLARRVTGRDDSGATEAAMGPSPPLEAFEAYVKALLADRPEAREKLLDAALAKAPAYDRVRLALWAARTDLADHAAALAVVQSIQDTSPVYRLARFHASLSLIELGRHEEAFDTLKLLAEIPSAPILNNLGVIQLRRETTPQTGRATYYFTKAAEYAPDDPDVLFNLGYAYWEERDAAAAAYWLREALRRNPADADAHFVLAASLEAAGATVEAERERGLARQLSDRYAAGSKDAPRRAATVPRRLERTQDSLTAFNAMRFDAALTSAAQRNQLDLVEFHLERARRFFDQHRDGDAEPELRRALFLSPYNAEAHLLMGRLYMRTGRLRDAISAFRISTWSDETPAAHVALGRALLDARDLIGARAAAERALLLDPEAEDARALLAELEASRPR